MDENRNLPTPDTSGVSGNQIAADSEIAGNERSPMENLHLAKTICGLAATHSRSLGGEVTSALIAGATAQLACDYHELKERHRDLTLKHEEQRNALEEARTEKAILAERIRSDGKNRHLRNLSMTVGTSLIGVGITLSRSQLDAYSFGAYGFGALLVIMG